MRFLDEQSIRHAPWLEIPSPHAVIRQTLTPEHAHALGREFPGAGYHYDVRDSDATGRKRYRQHNMDVINAGMPVDAVWQGMSESWKSLIKEVCSPAYTDAMAAFSPQGLSGTRLDARLVMYKQEGWIENHLDRPDKVLTHLIYFNDVWSPGWGGELGLHFDSSSPAAARIFPNLGVSVIMLRSFNSWHSVAPVVGDQPRKLLLVHFVQR